MNTRRGNTTHDTVRDSGSGNAFQDACGPSGREAHIYVGTPQASCRFERYGRLETHPNARTKIIKSKCLPCFALCHQH